MGAFLSGKRLEIKIGRRAHSTAAMRWAVRRVTESAPRRSPATSLSLVDYAAVRSYCGRPKAADGPIFLSGLWIRSVTGEGVRPHYGKVMLRQITR